MRASVLTALLPSFCPTISVTSSGLSSKWLMSDWHSPRMALSWTDDTRHFSRSQRTERYRRTQREAAGANLRRSRVLRAGADPAAAADGVGEPLVVPHLREAQRSLATHAHGQGPAAGVWLLHVDHLEGHRRHSEGCRSGQRPREVNEIHQHPSALLTSRIGMTT